MNRIFIPLIAMALFFGSCSSDGDGPQPGVGVGSLEVLALFDGTALPGASVETIPKTSSMITDLSGKTMFKDIPAGDYQIIITLPGTQIKVALNVKVRAGQVEYVEMELAPDPISELPIELEVLLLDLYKGLQGEYLFDANGYSLYWGDIGMDLARINPQNAGRSLELDLYLFHPEDNVIGNVWTAHYRLVRICNRGLEALESGDYAPIDGTTPGILEAEFRFLRALFYFNLVKLYGNPLLVTQKDLDLTDLSTLIQGRLPVYGQIVEDLEFAQLELPPIHTKTRASKEAATALLGKVYLTMAGYPLGQTDKYQLALGEFEKILGSFSLEPEYGDVFGLGTEASNTEVIFSVPFEHSGNYGALWGPKGISFNDRLLLTPGFVDSFFEGGAGPTEPVHFPLIAEDSRFHRNLATFSFEDQQVVDLPLREDWRPYKFIEEPLSPKIPSETSFDYPYLRMADVLLMIAEVENEVNGPTPKAYDALNQVRRRAFGNGDHDVPDGLDPEGFLRALIRERKLEFCFEGQLKDDLIRMGVLEAEILAYNEQVSAMERDFQPHEYIWPIPLAESSQNPYVEQNDGYMEP